MLAAMATVARTPMRSASQPIRTPPAPVPTHTNAPAKARTDRSVPSASCIGFMPTTMRRGAPKEIDRMANVTHAAFHESRLSMLPRLSALPSAAASFIFIGSLGRHYHLIATSGTRRLSPCAISGCAASLRFAAELDLRPPGLVDGLAQRHLVAHPLAGELRRRPPDERLAFADDIGLVRDQRSVAPELRRHRRLAVPPRRGADRDLLVQAAALVVEADPAGLDSDLFPPAVGEAVRHGHVAAEHPASLERGKIAFGPVFGRQGWLRGLAPLHLFPEIVLAGGELGFQLPFIGAGVIERDPESRHRIGHSSRSPCSGRFRRG